MAEIPAQYQDGLPLKLALQTGVGRILDSLLPGRTQFEKPTINQRKWLEIYNQLSYEGKMQAQAIGEKNSGMIPGTELLRLLKEHPKISSLRDTTESDLA